MKILKAILLISAFTFVALRLTAHNNAEFLGATADLMNIISFVAMGVCGVCAVIWCILIKKEEKAQKAPGEEAEEQTPENDGI